jgi:hypothetical protein
MSKMKIDLAISMKTQAMMAKWMKMEAAFGLNKNDFSDFRCQSGMFLTGKDRRCGALMAGAAEKIRRQVSGGNL